ncbi:MAG: 4-alpha-glucanotransferase [Burkholderiaceae bacterium]|nr:4-alpha-glucanotransferase [Burkholderiaceae bacterium]
MNIVFTLHYATQFGENIFLHLSQDGVDGIAREIPLGFVDAHTWSVSIDCAHPAFTYHYSIQNSSGQILREELPVRTCSLVEYANKPVVHLVDRWDLASFPEHFLFNKIWNIHQPSFADELSPSLNPTASHLFEIRVPLYSPHWAVGLIRSGSNNWIPMHRAPEGLWQINLDLSVFDSIDDTTHCFEYQYCIFDTVTRQRIHTETHLRHIQLDDDAPKKLNGFLTIVHDLGYEASPDWLWRSAGVAIPVFSLRSEHALGSGEFADLKLLGDWARQAGISLLQLLPINDSTVNYSWDDQYPYSAISAYALHPQYLSIHNLPYALPQTDTEVFEAARARLNALEAIDFESMITLKWRLIRSIFNTHRDEILADENLHRFIANNDWLKPYAVFCVLRDEFNTLDFSQWQAFARYDAAAIQTFFIDTHPQYLEVVLHCFVQYHLHVQLSEAVDYVHGLGIALKGDLPIGIRRYSVDTWGNPDLFAMDFQAGAPPDMFTELGQNWEFPLYNWSRMRTDGYQWWGQRMSTLAQYFDAMRIDHVLGFFRIWCVPIHAIQGLLGYFSPALGITTTEFAEREIEFDAQRFCEPFITTEVLESLLGNQAKDIIATYLQPHDTDASRYQFKQAFDTQRKIADCFRDAPNTDLEQKLLALHAEVLFIAERLEQGANQVVYHPRFNQHKTQSYRALDTRTQEKLHDLYVDYFFVRQEALWRQNGLEKLPALKNASDMLICAEDLGLVPACVPEVLNELGMTALKIQRAPSDDTEFSDPLRAGYLNVVTTSSHDSSTLRQWWCENPELTQRYYEQQLGQVGDAPTQLTPELASLIIEQHLNSPAMLAIFPLQDILATSAHLVPTDPNVERINNPANPHHRWNYRMSMGLEQLILEREWSEKVREQICRARRITI